MDTQTISSDTLQNDDEAFLQIARTGEAADGATRNYRGVFNAYVKVAPAEAPTGETAAIQGAVAPSFAKRYTPKAVVAIEALLPEEPSPDAIHSGIRAVCFEDLRGISDALDRAMKTAESERGFAPRLPAVDKGRAASRAVENLGNAEL